MTNNPNNQQPLPPGYEFQAEKLRVERVLGAGGFGITYLVRDLHVDDYRVLKENFPKSLSLRASGSVVSLVSGDSQGDYDYLLKRFIFESEQLQRFSGHPNIANVVGSFRANNTAYMLMSYRPGKTLAEHIQQSNNRPLSEDEIKLLCLPVLKGLQAMHAADLLHLDIKPENIYIPSLGEPYLIDFGGARHFSGAESQRLSQYSSMLRTPGYAPPEQNSTQKQHQAATDLYAFGATLYYAISSHAPIDANDRRAAMDDDDPDPLTPALEIGARRYSKELLRAIDACLRIKRKDRPQSVAELLQLLPSSWRGAESFNYEPDKQAASQDSDSEGETKIESGPESPDVWRDKKNEASPENKAFINSDSLTKWVTWSLYAQIAVAIISIISGNMEYQLLSAYESGVYASQWQAIADGEASDARQAIVAIVAGVVYLISGIMILKWIYRANHNARRLGAKDMKFTPGWSIGWYFIPIFSFWMPYRAMKEIWQASIDPDNWSEVKLSSILPWWWFFYLTSVFFAVLSDSTADSAEEIAELKSANIVYQISDFSSIVLALVTMAMIKAIYQAQINRANSQS